MKKSLLKITMIISLALLLCFTFSCQKQVTEEVPEGITEEEAKAFLDSVLEIWNDGNLDLVTDVYSAEIVVSTSTFPEDIVGIEGVKNWVTGTRTAFPDFYMTFDEVIVKGDKIVTQWTSTGTNSGILSTPLGDLPPTGKKMHVSGLAINRVENGKAAEELVVYNVLEIMQQLGFTLTPPPPPEPPEEKK